MKTCLRFELPASLRRVLPIAPFMLLMAPALALEPDKIFELVSPTVVLVVAANSQQGFISQGSGVVIAPETVVTNCHVLRKAKSISVKLGKEFFEAQLQYPDVERDLCQIRVLGLKAPAARIGSTKNLKVGQRVYALGNPEGLEQTFSEGLYSAQRGKEGNKRLQVSASITHGSSGGGLFDSQGLLIGITSSGVKDGELGLNFAIPADYIADLPKRGEEALAALKPRPGEGKSAEPAQAAQSEGSNSPGKSSEPKGVARRKLSSEEILAQFSPGRELMANETNTKFSLKVLENGKWVRRYCDGCNVKFGDARLELKAESGQVCFQWSYVTYPDGGCFEVLQIGEASYQLESLERGRPITYRMLN